MTVDCCNVPGALSIAVSKEPGTLAACGAGLKLAIERGWLWMHESGTYVKVTHTGAEPFA
jgi:hypothetical protein